MNPGAVLIGIPLLHFRKMSVWPFDGIYCGAPVLHMRGLCIDIRAMQQEHSFSVIMAFLLLTSFAIPVGAFCVGLIDTQHP